MSEEEKEQSAEASEEEAKGNASDGEEGEGGEEGDAAAPKKKKKILLLGLIVLVILIAIPAGLHFSGVFPLFGGEDTEESHAESSKGDGENAEGEEGAHGESGTASIPNLPSPPVTFELDEFLVNLNTPGKQSRFLKMTIALELPGQPEKEAIQPYVPRIRDAFQLYLRELREEDVRGSAALYRLREELMLRLSKVVYPIKVDDILFKEILTQ